MSPSKLPRPSGVTLACLFIGFTSLVWLFTVGSMLSGWTTLQRQTELRDLLTELSVTSVSQDTQMEILRIALMFTAALAVTGMILAIYALRGHRPSRIILSVLAFALALIFGMGGAQGLIPAAFALGSIYLLWTAEARRWYALVNGVPAPPRSLPLVPDQPSTKVLSTTAPMDTSHTEAESTLSTHDPNNPDPYANSPYQQPQPDGGGQGEGESSEPGGQPGYSTPAPPQGYPQQGQPYPPPGYPYQGQPYPPQGAYPQQGQPYPSPGYPPPGPYGYPGQPGFDGPPKRTWHVIASAVITLVGAAFAMLVSLLGILVFGLLWGPLQEEAASDPDLADQLAQVEGLETFFVVISSISIVASVIGIIAAILLLRGSFIGWILLYVACAMTIVLSVATLPLGLVTGAAAVTVIVFISLKPARAWVNSKRS